MVFSVWKNNQFKFAWYWELLTVLIQHNLKRRYRGSFLGVYWSLLNPLLMTVVYAAIFGQNFIEQKHYNSIEEYCLAAFTGLLVINFFSSSTAQALASIVDNGTIVNKIKLPLSVFPLSTIGANIFQLSMGSFPLLLIVTLIYSHSLVNTLALLFPIISLILVCSGVGMLMSSLYVFFRDLSYFYELVTFLLLFSLEFAELEDYALVPVKGLSSGMSSRLGFAIATDIKPEILILDEVLSVGDVRFKNKCAQRMEEFWQAHVTVLLVSHSMELIKDTCYKAIWLDKGRLKLVGKTQEVVDRYLESFDEGVSINI